MELNRETQLAWEFVEYTGRSIFLTGKAGTGKTTFLRYVCEHSTKRIVVVAPTGVAAINANGVTIHSFFQLPLSPFVPNASIKSRFDFSKEKKKIIRTLDMLIIDEISMVRSDLLDAVDAVLRRLRGVSAPFGGVQLVMIGDLQQLTPVVTPEDEHILQGLYETPYFFSSKALQQIDYVTIQLEQVYRQQDGLFLDILNRIRDGKATCDDLQTLNQRAAKPLAKGQEPPGFIRLTTHNNLANSYNQGALERLTTPEFTFTAQIDGTFPEYAYPTDVSLTLKEGAQVMFVKNDTSPGHLYYNGRIGHIVEIDDRHVKVYCEGDAEAIEVEPQRWDNARYTLNRETREIETEVQGTFTQLPLRLAWAITIHKSQGLTFDHVAIDASLSFAPGQVYVALSRCKTLEGIVMATPIQPHAIINDNRVSNYIDHQQAAAEESTRQLPLLKEEYHRQLLVELFTFNAIGQAEENLSRLFTEHLYNQYHTLALAHKQALQDYLQKVSSIAYKWTLVIGSTPAAALHGQPFTERVGRSCKYFAQTLEGIFLDLLAMTKGIEVRNEAVRERMKTYLSDLTEAYTAKCYTLRRMAAAGFSTEGYLHTKQMALLDAIDEAATAEKKPRKTTRTKRKSTRKS